MTMSNTLTKEPFDVCEITQHKRQQLSINAWVKKKESKKNYGRELKADISFQ